MKITVCILGATGSVGRQFIELLEDHPLFEVTTLMASSRSIGKKIGPLVVQECDPSVSCDLVFSALDAAVAGPIEEAFASAGKLVISNAKSHRWHPDVPLVIPEVNAEHLQLVARQKWSGGIVTTPNCVVIPLCMALKPLDEHFGVEALHVVSLQAISGAGRSGLSALEIQDNVIPYIAGEQEKIEREPFKIMGWHPEQVAISAQCTRVPVSVGHTLCVSVKLRQEASLEAVRAALEETTNYHDDEVWPQPRLHGGMDAHTGQLQSCPVLSCRFTIVADNRIRGAAGNAIRTAERKFASIFS